jgi:hypothetical protein
MLAAASTFAAAAAAAAADVQGFPHTPIIPKPPVQHPCLRSNVASPPPASAPQAIEASAIYEAELQGMGMPLPPYGTAVCTEVLLGQDWLCSSKFPHTIRKRLEALQSVSLP